MLSDRMVNDAPMAHLTHIKLIRSLWQCSVLQVMAAGHLSSHCTTYSVREHLDVSRIRQLLTCFTWGYLTQLNSELEA